MIINDPYENRSEEEISKIKNILENELPKKVKERNFGFGEKWNLKREHELQDWLDKVSNKFNFDFRLLYANKESLYTDDYLKPTIYR